MSAASETCLMKHSILPNNAGFPQMTQTALHFSPFKTASRLSVVAALASATLLAAVSAQAQTAQGITVTSPDMAGGANVPDTFSKRVQIGVGKSMIVELPQDASEIFVANPSVVNAVVRSARKIYLVAAANGQTSIFAMNKAGKQIAIVQVSVGRDIDELRNLIKAAMPHTNIDVRTISDTIILSGTVDSALEAQKAEDIASAFVGYSAVGGGSSNSGSGSSISFGSPQIVQGKLINSIVIRGKDQVMLKVTIAEVQRLAVKQLGVDTRGNWGTWGSSNMASTVQSSTYSADIYKAIGIATNGTQGNLAATLMAFERNGVGHILAEPNVTAISGESAQFTAGGEVPVYSNETAATSTTGASVLYAYKPYGITLNFTPVVLSEGRIQLHLATEVTEVDSVGGTGAVSRRMPSFTTRRHTTTLELPSGGSIVSAGLIQQHSTATIDGTPGLTSLPVLGTLFRSREYQRNETELMIVVTPYITKTLRPEEISKPDDGFADASDPQGVFLGRVNRIYSTSQNPQLMKNFKGHVGFITD